MKINFTITIIIISCLTLFQCSKQDTKDAAKEISVKYRIAEECEFDNIISEVGITRGINESLIYPKVANKRIEKVLVNEGSKVKSGQVLAILEHEYALKQLDAQKAFIKSIQANISSLNLQEEVLSSDAKRLQNLYEKGIIGKQQVEHITSQLNSMRMQIKATEAQLDQAKSTLEYMESLVDNHFIRAPFDGLITKIYLKENAYTDMMLQKPFGIVSSDKKIEVLVNLPELYLNDVKEKQEAVVSLDIMPEKKWKAKVYRVARELDKLSRTFSVELLINNPDDSLKSGMTALVSIKTGFHRAIAIPYSAIQRYPATGVFFAFVIENNIIQQRNIEIGQILNDLVEIKLGIKKGEKVIISANRRIVAGMKAKEIKD